MIVFIHQSVITFLWCAMKELDGRKYKDLWDIKSFPSMNWHSVVTKRCNGRTRRGGQSHLSNTYVNNYYVSGTLPGSMGTQYIFFKLKICCSHMFTYL